MTEPFADDDDDALRALGRRAREHVEARPLAWEAVTRGERAEDEVAAERLAAGDSPQDVALARELFRPLDEAEHDALMSALLDPRAASPAPAAASEPAPSHEPAEVVLPPAELASEAANDPGRRAWLWGLLAIAAVIALGWWLVPDRTTSSVSPDPPVIALAPLPAYEALKTDGGLVAVRSEPADPGAAPRYRPGMQLEWILSPKVAVEGDLRVRLFAFGEGTAKAIATEGLVQTSPKGAVRVAGKVDALGLPAGTWTIAVVVGRPSALPSDPAVVRDTEGSETWIVRRQPLVLED